MNNLIRYFAIATILTLLFGGLIHSISPTPEVGEDYLGDDYYQGKNPEWELMVIFPPVKKGESDAVMIYSFQSYGEMVGLAKRIKKTGKPQKPKAFLFKNRNLPGKNYDTLTFEVK